MVFSMVDRGLHPGQPTPSRECAHMPQRPRQLYTSSWKPSHRSSTAPNKVCNHTAPPPVRANDRVIHVCTLSQPQRALIPQNEIGHLLQTGYLVAVRYVIGGASSAVGLSDSTVNCLAQMRVAATLVT
jgi:hypothetical protein